MASCAPSIQTKNFTNTRQHLSQIVNQVARRETRILIEKSGVPVAGIVSADDLRRLAELDAARDERAEAMREISRAFADVPLDELEAQVTRALRQTREEQSRQTARDAGR
jgi:prevent-host-death family protein